MYGHGHPGAPCGTIRQFCCIGNRPPAGVLNPSGSAVTDGHPGAFEDDRDRATSLCELEHLGQLLCIADDVVVLDRIPPGLIRLTGGYCIGSGVLPEDAYAVRHAFLLCRILAPVIGCDQSRIRSVILKCEWIVPQCIRRCFSEIPSASGWLSMMYGIPPALLRSDTIATCHTRVRP